MLVSVALCTYNGEKYIVEQIDSILNQTLPVNEIVICDDGSTDKTIEIIYEYSERNPNIFKIYKNEENLRSVKNFEKAISLCNGDFIFLSDQDDKWVETKVEKYINFFNQHPEISVLASNGYCMDENSNLLDFYAIWDVPSFLKEKNISFNFNKMLTHVGNFATGAAMALRKSFTKEVIPFPILKDYHHDEWIALISSKENKFDFINEKLFYYRVHSNQQVGGISYEKDRKKSLTDGFNLNECNSFIAYKRRLKKLNANYYKMLDLVNASNTHKDYLNKTANTIKEDYYKIHASFKKDYPLRSSLLKWIDSITKKRSKI